MKKSRILTAALSAVTAVTALSTTASAVWVKPDEAPLIDLTPSVEGERYEEWVKIDEVSSVLNRYYLDKNGEKVTGKKLLWIDYSFETEIGSAMRMVEADPETGELHGNYTGFTKSSEGRRYYDDGKRIYGWYKIGNSWYHFDENGYADTGKVKICGASYTFNEKGKWTGKVSKSGIAPKDFELTYASGWMNSFSTDGNIFYGEDYEDEKYEKQIKFSARDRQVMYCMFLESGFEIGKDYRFESEDVYETVRSYGEKYELGDDLGICETTDTLSDIVTVSYGGKTSKISFGYDSYQLIHLEEDFLRGYILTNNIYQYRRNYLYKKYPMPEGVDWVTLV